jgi:hypothetical protein
MNQLMSEDLARAHLSRRLADAERERLGQYVARLARARRVERRARRTAQAVEDRLHLIVS